MEEYIKLMEPALRRLDAVKAAVDEVKGHMGEMGRKEDLLAILDRLDTIDVGLDEVHRTCSRQEMVFLKMKRNRVLLAGK